MTSAAIPLTRCRRCGAMLPPFALACANCGQFVYVDHLEQLSAEALRLEPINAWAAASLWREALQLLPPDSPQHHTLQNRIGVLSAGLMPADPMPASSTAPVLNYHRDAAQDSFGRAMIKTLGSMLLSIVVYAAVWGSVEFAVGFCVLMLVHELGHVMANRYYGLRASPPIFVPFMGAVINLKQRPPNAKVEAVVGIGGPLLGTAGAFACYLAFRYTGLQILGACAYFGFMLNLFNLLPVPPLDGGRITAAVSPWIWTLGLAGLAWLFIYDFQQSHRPSFILILVLIYAFPRIRATLRGRERFGEYYNISRSASWTIGVLYVALGIFLLIMFQVTGNLLPI